MMRAWLLVVLAACGDNAARAPDPHCADWHQWGGNAQHTGASCAVGQPLQKILADIPIDLLAADEVADAQGDLVVHYQAPLIDGDRMAMVKKGGTYTPCVPETDPANRCTSPADYHRFETQTWSEVGYAWNAGALVEQWTYDSQWKPPLGEEVVFQPVVSGSHIAVPEAEGAVAYLDPVTGAVDRIVRPFAHDASVYIVGALADWHGAVFYNAVKLDPSMPSGVVDSWLVEIDTEGRARKARYVDLVEGVPDQCYGTYFSIPAAKRPAQPWPPLDDNGKVVLPPTLPCGPQIPGFNAAPAIAEDGTVYVVSSALDNESYSYVTSVNPGFFDVNWSRSLRDQLHDGCGVDIPYASEMSDHFERCADGAPKGVDDTTGLPPAGLVDSGSTSSPVVMPDGRILYGSLSLYNEERGHLFEFSRDGQVLGTYDFGWDLTPAVATVAGEARIVLKDNHYGTYAPGHDGPYDLTMLDDSLEQLWQYQSTDTQSCARQPDGTVTCKDDHPHGFEWCINAPAIDANGTMYANSEDGNVYAIGADGQERDHLLLDTALGASYTPVALDREGRVYALNAGHLYVVGAN